MQQECEERSNKQTFDIVGKWFERDETLTPASKEAFTELQTMFQKMKLVSCEHTFKMQCDTIAFAQSLKEMIMTHELFKKKPEGFGDRTLHKAANNVKEAVEHKLESLSASPPITLQQKISAQVLKST